MIFVVEQIASAYSYLGRAHHKNLAWSLTGDCDIYIVYVASDLRQLLEDLLNTFSSQIPNKQLFIFLDSLDQLLPSYNAFQVSTPNSGGRHMS